MTKASDDATTTSSDATTTSATYHNLAMSHAQAKLVVQHLGEARMAISKHSGQTLSWIVANDSPHVAWLAKRPNVDASFSVLVWYSYARTKCGSRIQLGTGQVQVKT